jgi:tRNA dimethylallyltransferase
LKSEPLMILVGPTAVGKTSLAVQLCQRFEAEIINADSVQVYRGLNIGSAKPTAEELATARHHLVDVVEPYQDFDAARFAELAEQAIDDIQARGKRVLVSGGTGLYIKALLFGLAPLPPVDDDLRIRLNEEWKCFGPAAMHARLADLDPESAGRLHPNDRQRVLRALEVCIQTGEPISAKQKKHSFASPRYPYFIIGLSRPKPELDKRIAKRCHIMWDQGLADEVKGLLSSGIPSDSKALGSLGYAQAQRYLDGEFSREEALTEMIARTKAYAKRQLTWFRGMESIHWLSPHDHSGVFELTAQQWRPQTPGER